MTAILVLAMFVAFILFQILTNEKTREYVLHSGHGAEASVRRVQPIVSGYEVPEHLRFHQGHAWALAESPSLVRVGIDDFAAKLIGEADEVNLPQRGQWIRQGQKIWSFRVNGELVEMVSPIEGTVNDVNDAVVRHPETLTADPYGDSWLMTVQSPDAKTNFRNLLGGALARWWTEESSMRLQRLVPNALGALAQDGGVAIDDVASTIPDEQWVKITREFFLS